MKPALIVLVCAAMSLVASAAPVALSVTVVGADKDDPRWHAVAEAVEFWNQQFADIGMSVRLGPIARLVQAVPDDALRRVSEVAVAGPFGGDIPQELGRVQGEIVVALSTADIISFGLRWSPERKGLVGLRRADIPPMSLPNVLRNVVAHELGHVLGLRHNSDPATVRPSRPVSAHALRVRQEPFLTADGCG
jgi:Met-zincin